MPAVPPTLYMQVLGNALAFAAGSATAPALRPYIQELSNAAWVNHRSRPLDPVAVANIVAEGVWTPEQGRNEAHKSGISDGSFDALVAWIEESPDLGTLLQLLRRGYVDANGFRAGLKDARLGDEWILPLTRLAQVLVSPDQLANARQQGFENIIDLDEEAREQGVTAARLELLYQLSGNPPGPEAALEMWRRGIITEGEFEQAIREGRTKTKYTDEYKALRWRLLTGAEYAGLWLRGWLTEAQAKAAGARVGYQADEMELLYLNRGRPATTRQVHIGWQRGGRLPGAANEREAFEQAVRQSNIRTEYVDLLWAQRYTYPSPFVLRALTQDGTFTAAQAEEALVHSGWRPDWAKLAAQKWAGATDEGPSTKWADRARTRLFTAAHSDYLDGNADEQDARAMLTAIGATGPEQTTILKLWDIERNRTRRDLTQAQILKLFKKGIWTRAQALDALEDLGMDPDDASDLLDAV